MAYKDREKDRRWHRDYMRKRRSGSKMGVTIEKHGVVTPEVDSKYDLSFSPPIFDRGILQADYDADGNVIPEY